MAEDISREIERRIAQRKAEEAEAAEAERLRREAGMPGPEGHYRTLIARRDGAAISEIREYVDVDTRRLLAGFALSAQNAKVKMEPNYRSKSHEIAGRNALKDSVSDMFKAKKVWGWNVLVGYYYTTYDDHVSPINSTIMVTPRFRLYSEHKQVGSGPAVFEPELIRDSVLRSLANWEAEWVEPDPAYY